MAKSKYVKDFPARAEAYAKQGLIDKEIARKLGISKQTFYDYQKKHPDFLDSLKRGKAPVDFKVENALLKRAMGYEYEETTVEYYAAVEDQKAKPKKIKKTKKTMNISNHFSSSKHAGVNIGYAKKHLKWLIKGL